MKCPVSCAAFRARLNRRTACARRLRLLRSAAISQGAGYHAYASRAWHQATRRRRLERLEGQGRSREPARNDGTASPLWAGREGSSTERTPARVRDRAKRLLTV